MGYGWLGQFRQGSWRSLRTFVLRERRDVSKRLQVIDSDLAKIGKITVGYKSTSWVRTLLGEKPEITEERTAFWVSRGSSLERLVQAYIANGGNPLDISHFFIPDQAKLIEQDSGELIREEKYPYGGLAWPYTSRVGEPENTFGPFQGGWLPILKYPPTRIGGRKEIGAESEIFVNYISALRKPFEKEIQEKIHNLESRIIKLCDLAEQLYQERNIILVQAFGGLMDSMVSFDEDQFARGLRVPNIVDAIDDIFYVRGETGVVDLDNINSESLSLFDNLWEDVSPQENNTAI